MGVVNPTIVVAMPSVDGSRFLAIREVSSFFIRRFVGDGLLKTPFTQPRAYQYLTTGFSRFSR